MNARPGTAWVVGLCCLIAILAAVAAGVGLLYQDGARFTFVSVHGQAVEMYGQGLYRADSLLAGSGFRGVDAVVLLLGLPLLVASAIAYRRRSRRGELVLIGILAFFLYDYASMAFGAAFNALFPVYIALFGASLAAFVIAVANVDLAALARSMSPSMPARGIAVFLFVVAAVLVAVWGSDLFQSMLNGRPSARIDNYTTVVTYVLDLGIVLPAMVVGGVLVLRRHALGYVIAAADLIVTLLLGPALTAMTVSQVLAGVSFTTGEVAGPVVGFTVVALLGMIVAVVLLRHVEAGLSSVPPADVPHSAFAIESQRSA